MKLEVIDRDTVWATLVIDNREAGVVRFTRAELEACLREMDKAGKIEVGDFVEVVATEGMIVHQRDRVGQLGKVLIEGSLLGVEFPRFSSLGHALLSKTKHGHGVWFVASMLRKVE